MFFINEALASESAAGSAGAIDILKQTFPMIAIFVVFYFLLIRPQVKKQKEIQKMISDLKKGDKVIVAGGLVGKIAKEPRETDETIILDTSETKIEVLKSSVSQKIAKEVKNKKEVDSKKEVENK